MKTLQITHTTTTREQETTISVENIEKIYIGKGGECLCGCLGEYTYQENEPKKIQRMVKRFSKLVSEGREVESMENNFFKVNCSKEGNKNRVLIIFTKEN